jgi:hypothetical protein
MKSIYLGILAITLGSMGCGGGGGNNDISLDDLPGELARAICEKDFDCCPQDSAAEYTSVEECISDSQLFTAILASWIRQSEQAGRVRYDAARAGECMDVIRGLACTALQAEDFCDDFIVPLVAAGGQCDQDFECVTGYCDAETETCATLPALGQPCNFDCAQGSYCDFGTRVCEAARADGAECFFDDECLSLYCDDDTGLCGQVPACT